MKRESSSKTKSTGVSILHLSTKDICAITFSTSQSSSITIHHPSRPSTWEKTKTKRLSLHSIFWLQKSVKLSADHKDKKDLRSWKPNLINWVFQRKTIGGTWNWENSVLFPMEVLVLDSKDWSWWPPVSKTSEMLPASQEHQEMLNSDLSNRIYSCIPMNWNR